MPPVYIVLRKTTKLDKEPNSWEIIIESIPNRQQMKWQQTTNPQTKELFQQDRQDEKLVK